MFRAGGGIVCRQLRAQAAGGSPTAGNKPVYFRWKSARSDDAGEKPAGICRCIGLADRRPMCASSSTCRARSAAPWSPASSRTSRPAAGIQSGDVIVSVNDRPVHNAREAKAAIAEAVRPAANWCCCSSSAMATSLSSPCHLPRPERAACCDIRNWRGKAREDGLFLVPVPRRHKAAGSGPFLPPRMVNSDISGESPATPVVFRAGKRQGNNRLRHCLTGGQTLTGCRRTN